MTEGADLTWPDKRLVEECLKGNEQAWGVLVDKYKNLIFSVVLKYGASQEEAADIFQGVWLDAYNDLPKLRKKAAFKGWLMKITTHKCYRWKEQQRRQNMHETNEIDPALFEEELAAPVEDMAEAEQDQAVRDAILSLPDRCREMVRMLFYTDPPVPYAEVAERLGLATGSIGFIRGRCLQKLQKALEKQGL